MKRFAKVFLMAFMVAFVTVPQTIYAQTSDSQIEDDDEYDGEGDFYEEEEIRLTQNGAGDQYIGLKLMPVFPLNFGKQLYVGGALSLGYHRFLSQYFAVGGDIMFGYNTTLGGNLFTFIPFTISATFQPYISHFEFPITLNVGAAVENYLQFNFFPGLFIKADAGCYYRLNENWSFGLECNFIYMPQWYSKGETRYDYYAGLTAAAAARYHF